MPLCPECGSKMVVEEIKVDNVYTEYTFRCVRCGRILRYKYKRIKYKWELYPYTV